MRKLFSIFSAYLIKKNAIHLSMYLNHGMELNQYHIEGHPDTDRRPTCFIE